VNEILAWLTSLPVAALYAVLAVISAVENIFPPVPADTVVAFGSFLAARGQGTFAGVLLVTWLGNLSGAMAMYWAGRRFGAERIEQRLAGRHAASAEARLNALYGRFGMAALFLSRFLPGIRALVPPFAGALKLPAWRVAIVMGIASLIWYGVVAWVGFTVGEDWQLVLATIKRYGAWIASGAAVVATVGLAVWWLRRRRVSAS
jgi:membrane protein DedA with SNARE-associated domain